MYHVIASAGLREAILEKDGMLYFSFGPKMVHKVRKRDLQHMFEAELEVRVNKGEYIRYNPPIEIASVEDWPAVVQSYEEQAKMRRSS
jgi:hypothetical protein